MQMLKEGEEADAEVTWEDQQNINSFSKLNARLDQIEEIYQEKKVPTLTAAWSRRFEDIAKTARFVPKQKEKEYLEDLESELELADEDELIKYRIGDAFVSLPLEECNERIASESAEISGELDKLSAKMEGIGKEMAKLKAILYGKFGKSINLER
ncbi:hypothetical protein HK104_008653 [Borealophlyctis nickersoniae]|nr:hypothetical protein HK104_008653 [Borealophlyctis nickersoniae]